MTTSAAAHAISEAAPLEAGLAEPIRAVLRDLAGPRQQIEGAFLDIGRCLVESNGMLRGITDTFGELASRLEGGEGADALGPFEGLARRILAITAEAAGDVRDLGPLIAQVNVLRRPVAELQRAVSSVGLVAVGTRISAAQLPGRNDFGAFITDIQRLAEQSTSSVSEFAAVYERLVTTLKAAESKRATLETTQKRALGGLAERLQSTLAAAAERRREAGDASNEIGALFSRIAAGVASIISALQVGDITRQRIEHVEEGMAFLLDPEAVAAHAPGGNRPALIAAVCRLQAAQGTQATADFEEEAGRAVNLMRQLAADTDGIVGRSRRIHEQTVEASRAAFAVLAGEVRRACALVRECETSRAELSEAATAVTTSVQELLRCVKAVQDIKGGMHILGINMALKCAWLGPEGDTLNVIAHELRELAGTTVIHANTAVVALNEAAKLAEAISATEDRGDTAEIGRLEEEVRNVAGQREGDRELADALALLVRDGTRVAGLLGKAAGRVTVQRDIGGAMRGAIAKIEEIRRNAEAAHRANGGGDLRLDEERALVALKGRYTMASERVLHDQFSGGRSKPAAAPVAAAELDDIFF